MRGKRRNKKEKGSRKIIAVERIRILFAQAARFGSKDLHHANRCIELARAIAMKERVRIPLPYRRFFCRNCYCYLIPTVTVQVRIHHGHIHYRCLTCGAIRRYPTARTIKHTLSVTEKEPTSRVFN
jgi:ribonuclease P protein subunit RPR2